MNRRSERTMLADTERTVPGLDEVMIFDACRPRERGDPVNADRAINAAELQDSILGYWVPAFAGTTGRNVTSPPVPRARALRSPARCAPPARRALQPARR